MDKLKNLEDKIKKNYKIVQNYLNGNPWAEWFLDSLADLQTNFADYLIEVLKTKEYGKEDVTKSNIYQWHIKWWKYKYIDNEVLEHIISNEVLWKKISIKSMLDEWIKKLEELFDTQKSLKEAFKSWKLQSFQLNTVILPPEDSQTPIETWSGKFDKKELNQNKLLLFISTLRELEIYIDDLIIYFGEVDNNMMRENTYYAIFIPRVNKTVFLNTWYWEATFICEWEVSIKNMTTLWKEKLENALWAIKINFSENNIIWWKNEIKIALLWESRKWKKVSVLKKISGLNELKNFYAKHKNDTFTDSEGKKISIWELIFNWYKYYKHKHNYENVNNNPSYNIRLPSDPLSHFKITWIEFLKGLWIEKIEKLEDLKAFYTDHKNDTFIDSDGETSTVEKLFSNYDYYIENYKRIFFLFDIRIPWYPQGTFNKTWREIQQEITDNNIEIISLEDLKSFISNGNLNKSFIDSNEKPSTIKKLFSNSKYYKDNYKLINPDNGFNFTLPSHPNRYYGKAKGWTWNDFLWEIWIYNVKISLEELQNLVAKNQDLSFTDSKNKKSTLKKLFSSIEYYKHNYINANNALDILLPGNPMAYYNKTWDELKKFLWLL